MSNTDTDKAIEEMLTGPTEEAGKEKETSSSKSEEETKTEATASETTQEESEKETTETDWKAEARKWETRAKDNRKEADDLKAAAEKVTELESEINKVTETHKAEIAEREQALEKANLEITRFKIAAKYGVSEEDVELFLTASDEETLEKQAQRLSQNSAHAPKPDAAQGRRTESGPASAKQQGAAALQELFD